MLKKSIVNEKQKQMKTKKIISIHIGLWESILFVILTYSTKVGSVTERKGNVLIPQMEISFSVVAFSVLGVHVFFN